MAPHRSMRSTWVSVGVNVLLSATQIIVGFAARSQALVADGLHSLSDIVADAVVLFAGHHSKKDADFDHPYGHQRFETGASLALGLLLIGVGLAMVWSAVLKLQTPALVQTVSIIALWIALAAMVAKEALFRYMLADAKRQQSDMLIANAWHARSDAASSLVVALGIGGSLAGYPILDPIAALIVGFMICKTGAGFAWAALNDLMDKGANQAEVDAITQTLSQTPGVKNVHDLRSRMMGDLLMVDAHIEVDATISVEAGHAIAVLAAQRVKSQHRVASVMTHIDPWYPKQPQP